MPLAKVVLPVHVEPKQLGPVGPVVVPSVTTLRSRFTARRKGGGVLDRVLRAVLGVEAKIRQYAEGAAYTRHIVDAVGMDGFNTVYKSFYNLPNIFRRMLPPPKGNYLESLFYVVANLKINQYLRKTPNAWGTIS